MKAILTEDISKITPAIEQVIKALGSGMIKTEYEQTITVGDTASIANVKGYWVGDRIRIDIKFRK